MNENNVLVIVDGAAKHLFINNIKMEKVLEVSHVTEPMHTPRVVVELYAEKFKVVQREYGISPSTQAFRHFHPAPPLRDKAECTAKFTDPAANFAGFPPLNRTADGHLNFGGIPDNRPASELELKVTTQVGKALTLRELQTNLPWSIRYSADFRANPMPHKDFAHALTHIHKAAGMLSAMVDDMDHRKDYADQADWVAAYDKYIADLVICALRMANTRPGGPLDLERAVKERIETKNGVKLP